MPSGAVRSDYDDILTATDLTSAQVEAVEQGILPGYSPDCSPGFGTWYERFRSRITIELSRRLLREIERTKARGDWAATERIARACLALDELNEEATLSLAECLALGGSKARAIALLDCYRQEVGRGKELALPAALLRRRIAERPLGPAGKDEFPFVGRDTEFSLLERAMRRARTGTPQIVAMFGEPGIGKSRIATEYSARAALDGWTTVATRLQPGSADRPFAAFSDIVRSAMELPGALGCAPESLAWLRQMLGIVPESSERRQPPPEVASWGIRSAVNDLIGSVAAEAPLLILIDDAQWIDAASLQLLRELATTPAPARTLVIVAARDAAAVAELSLFNDNFTSIAIQALSRRHLAEITRSQLGGDVDGSLGEWMVDTAQGNPFFLRCLLRHFAETGSKYAVPRQLADLVDHRINAASRDARQVLSIIARLGKRASLDNLQELSELPFAQIVAAIQELERNGLVRMGDVIEVAHWLIAESDARLCTPLASQMIHLRVADLIQRSENSWTHSATLWDLSTHLAAGGQRSQAAQAVAACANYACQIGRSRDAADLFIRAADLSEEPIGRSRYLECALQTAASVNEADIVVQAAHQLREFSPLPLEAEIAVIDARLALEKDISPEHSRLLAILSDCSTHITTRVRAAAIFLVSCDQARTPITAIAALMELARLWDDARVTELDAMRLRLIFESSFGDDSKADALARRILACSVDQRAEIASHLQRTAAIGLHRVGRLSESRAAFKQAYQSASALGLTRLQHQLALMIAGQLLDEGLVDAADEWHATAQQHHWGTRGDHHRVSQLAFEVERAVLCDDRDALCRMAETADLFRKEHDSRRVGMWCEVLGLYSEHVKGARLDPGILATVAFQPLTKHLEHGESADLRITLVLKILIEARQSDTASDVLRRYLREYRRSAPPIPKHLASLGEGLPNYGVALVSVT